MHRLLCLAVLLTPIAGHSASLKDFELTKTLEKVAANSNIGTPRVISNDILDKGFSVNGNQLINHLAVIPAHAEQMRANTQSMRMTLKQSVCQNQGFVTLMSQGAVMRYQFTELPGEEVVLDERFSEIDCR